MKDGFSKEIQSLNPNTKIGVLCLHIYECDEKWLQVAFVIFSDDFSVVF